MRIKEKYLFVSKDSYKLTVLSLEAETVYFLTVFYYLKQRNEIFSLIIV